MIKSQGIVFGKRDGDFTITGYEDHYSQKYERCFMTISTMNSAAGTPGHTEPAFTTDLYDAFEGKLLATSGYTLGTWAGCHIEGIPGSISYCLEADAFIEDRMQN